MPGAFFTFKEKDNKKDKGFTGKVTETTVEALKKCVCSCKKLGSEKEIELYIKGQKLKKGDDKKVEELAKEKVKVIEWKYVGVITIHTDIFGNKVDVLFKGGKESPTLSKLLKKLGLPEFSKFNGWGNFIISGSEITDGDDMELECGDKVTFVSTETVEIALILGLVPRPARFKIYEKGADVVKKWSLGSLELDIYDMSDNGDFYFKSKFYKNKYLFEMVKKEWDCPVIMSGDHLEEAEKLGAEGNDAALIATIAATTRKPVEEVFYTTVPFDADKEIKILFKCGKTKEDFKLVFKKGEKVGDAKKKVAEKYKLKAEDIALHFMGKALRDGFVLDRLRLDEKAIDVYIKDDSEILLLTAKANRLQK